MFTNDSFWKGKKIIGQDTIVIGEAGRLCGEMEEAVLKVLIFIKGSYINDLIKTMYLLFDHFQSFPITEYVILYIFEE